MHFLYRLLHRLIGQAHREMDRCKEEPVQPMHNAIRKLQHRKLHCSLAVQASPSTNRAGSQRDGLLSVLHFPDWDCEETLIDMERTLHFRNDDSEAESEYKTKNMTKDSVV